MSDDSRVEKLPVNAIAGHAPCSQFHRNCTCRDCTTYVTLRTGANAEREAVVSYLTTDKSRGVWTWDSSQHPFDTIAEKIAGGKHVD